MLKVARIGMYDRFTVCKGIDADHRTLSINSIDVQAHAFHLKASTGRVMRPCDMQFVRSLDITYIHVMKPVKHPEPSPETLKHNECSYTLPGDPAKHTKLRSGASSRTFFTKFQTFKSYASPICPTGSKGQASWTQRFVTPSS